MPIMIPSLPPPPVGGENEGETDGVIVGTALDVGAPVGAMLGANDTLGAAVLGMIRLAI